MLAALAWNYRPRHDPTKPVATDVVWKDQIDEGKDGWGYNRGRMDGATIGEGWMGLQ